MKTIKNILLSLTIAMCATIAIACNPLINSVSQNVEVWATVDG